MQKIALILHGWPQFEVRNRNSSSYFLITHLRKKGFEIVAPVMFKEDAEFNLDYIKHIIFRSLLSRKPSVIVGISFGGLVLPHIARFFPKTRLIFITSGPYFKPEPFIFNVFLFIARFPLLVILVKKFIDLPENLLEKVYVWANPFEGDDSNRRKYERDKKINIRYVKKISVWKNVELVKFTRDLDNSKVLQNLNNSSLIFSSTKDHFMNVDGGRKLQQLLKNSKLIVNRGEHFNGFTKKDLKIVDRFLEK